MTQKHTANLFLFSFIALCIALFLPMSGDANTVNDLKNKIADRSSEIEDLEKEINEYKKALDAVGKEKASLQREINTVNLTQKKIATDIKITKNKIYAGTLNIDKLSLEIVDKEAEITNKIDTIKATIRRIDEIENNSLVELVLSSSNISEFWNDIENFRQFQTSMEEDVDALRDIKDNLQSDKIDIEAERENQIILSSKLSDQKKIADATRAQKDTLMLQTKNKEANYQNLLEEKKQLKEQFEQELLDLESQLRIAIDPNAFPKAGEGVLRPPLDISHITQYFGNTEFAKSGAYNGSGHNGVDFGTSIGTEVRSALSGTVVGIGNTDVGRCQSYGKWVLIKHNNGLSTLYAHLSLIKVKEGQNVNTGQIVAYSGNTGYSTGPHLHLTVYASQGVKVVNIGDWYKEKGRSTKTACAKANVTIPVAPLNAYLNPLDYI